MLLEMHNNEEMTQSLPVVEEDIELDGILSEAQLVLLCLDFLRDLRRSYTPQDLAKVEGLDADYLSASIYCLSRSFLKPSQLKIQNQEGNDAWVNHERLKSAHPEVFSYSMDPVGSRKHIELPELNNINKEILFQDVLKLEKEDEKHDYTYDYDDTHSSNSHRFYLLNGLSSGPSLNSSLTLGEIAAAGLIGLGARSRLDAERDMIKSPLFEQFVEAVRAKGFFRCPETEERRDSLEEESKRQEKAREIYDERYRKVVAKFRTKLASKAQQEEISTTNENIPLSGSISALNAADRHRRRRQERIISLREKHKEGNSGVLFQHEHCVKIDVDVKAEMKSDAAVSSPVHNTKDLEEAERLKSQGNLYMQKKNYQEAVAAYTTALKLSPSGPHSHVYFSNRAAALLSMKKFEDAILDSERSLALKPDYGKAHARLGLAHFLLGDYRQAMEAYTVSLKYDPDNKSSKNYLEKAAKRLAKQDSSEKKTSLPGSSYSVVSEWDKSVSVKSKSAVAKLPVSKDDENKSSRRKEAEKFKLKGNSYMASRDYRAALEAYSKAIEISPDGANSHVYFSNRAAALCYLERYHEAESDSEKSLALEPTYGKAHARLGLSRFFLGNYRGAVEAYTNALEYDPSSSASKSYLAKAKARLKREEEAGKTSKS